MVKIMVIGGGAAGLLACCVLAEQGLPDTEILLLEKEPRVGKKLLATGNGRCNLTNLQASPADYDDAAAFVTPALTAFPPKAAMAYFDQLGLLTRAEADGKVYPACNQAAAVLDLLRLHAARRGVVLQTDTAVLGLQQQKKGWKILLPTGAVTADAVIVAVGGLAAPHLGGSREGYRLLENLGHHVTDLTPALVQLKTENALTRAMKGLKLEAEIQLYQEDILLGAETGELLFTEYGVSGPPIFQLSRLLPKAAESSCQLRLDFMPAYSAAEIQELLIKRRQQLADFLLEDFMTGLVQKRLGQGLLKACGIAPLSRSAASLTMQECADLAAAGLKSYPLAVTGRLGWKQAQVTAGGILRREVAPENLESRLAPHVYVVGEVLDVDGPCGGYNLQWAWASAYLAARDIIKKQKESL